MNDTSRAHEPRRVLIAFPKVGPSAPNLPAPAPSSGTAVEAFLALSGCSQVKHRLSTTLTPNVETSAQCTSPSTMHAAGPPPNLGRSDTALPAPKGRKLAPELRQPHSAQTTESAKSSPQPLGEVEDPWDIGIDTKFDVLANADNLFELDDETYIKHWVPKCATFSRARDKPYIAELAEKVGIVCDQNSLRSDVCLRTGQRWKHTLREGKVVEFSTEDLSEYPINLCQAQSRGYIRWAINHGGNLSRTKFFLEAFSEPNARLTSAVKTAAAPHDLNLTPLKGIVPAVVSRSLENKPLTAYQQANRAAGRQPRWSNGSQPIQVGANNPVKHSELAKLLTHPSPTDQILSPELKATIAEAVAEPNIVRRRIDFVHFLERKPKKTATERDALYQSEAGYTFEAINPPINVPLMELVGDLAQIVDRALPRKLLCGLPIVGPADESPFFEPLGQQQDTLPIESLLRPAPQRRRRTVDKTQLESRKAKPALLQTVFKKTMEEVELGQMSNAMTEAEVTAKRGPLWNVAQRYGIEQGLKPDGSVKYRCIDNHLDTKAMQLPRGSGLSR